MIWQRGNAGAVIAFDIPNIIVPNQNEKNRFNPLKKNNQKEKKLTMAEFTSHLFPPFSSYYLTLPYLGLTVSASKPPTNYIHKH